MSQENYKPLLPTKYEPEKGKRAKEISPLLFIGVVGSVGVLIAYLAGRRAQGAYRVQYSDNQFLVSVRHFGLWNDITDFVQPDDNDVVAISPQIALNKWSYLDWVCRNISYREDVGEFWQLPSETLTAVEGDCEDTAILLASMLRRFTNAYVILGNYQGWGHAWVASEGYEILEATYSEARLVSDPDNYCPYVLFNDQEAIELWPGALREVFQLRRNEATKLNLMAQAPQVVSSNPGYIPGAKVPGGAYAELPEVCYCQACGYRIEKPGEHCAVLRCPQCGARLWRQK